MQVSRIDRICVVANLYIDLKTPNGNERVIVTVPLNVKLHLKRYSFYLFFRGHGNESCNLIGSLSGQYFPISAHGPR